MRHVSPMPLKQRKRLTPGTPVVLMHSPKWSEFGLSDKVTFIHIYILSFTFLNFVIKHLWKYASPPIRPSSPGACWPVAPSSGRRRLLEAGARGPGICRASGLTGSAPSPPHPGPRRLCHPSGFSWFYSLSSPLQAGGS